MATTIEATPEQAASTKEDEAVACMVATLGGAINTDDPQRAIAAYLLVSAPPEIHDDPTEAAAIANELAQMIIDAAPTPDGVSLSGYEPRVVDLQFSDGVVGRGGYARELMFRARYAVNAIKRIAKAALGGKRQEQTAKERAHFEAHKQAAKHREQALGALDDAAARYGPVLGWYAVDDSSVTAECKAASGSNFDIGNPPKIGLPGLVHPRCRCHAGPKHPNGEML